MEKKVKIILLVLVIMSLTVIGINLMLARQENKISSSLKLEKENLLPSGDISLEKEVIVSSEDEEELERIEERLTDQPMLLN